MSTASRYYPEYTVEDYQLLEGDWELWDGVAVAMTPSPFGRHSRLVVELAHRLISAINTVGYDATVLSEIDWVVSQRTVIRPDVTVVCGREPERHLEATPALVAEVFSDSTRSRDLKEKRAIYQEQQVPWYLQVDPDEATLTVLHLQDGEYQPQSAVDSHRISICGSCEFDLSTNGLFR